MIVGNTITLSMPELSAKAAYELEELMSILAHEVGLYYGAEIRSYLQRSEWEEEQMEIIEAQIEKIEEEEAFGSQQEFPF